MAKTNPNLRKRVCPNCDEINAATVNACVACRHDIHAVAPVVPEEVTIETAVTEMLRRMPAFPNVPTPAEIRRVFADHPVPAYLTTDSLRAVGDEMTRRLQPGVNLSISALDAIEQRFGDHLPVVDADADDEDTAVVVPPRTRRRFVRDTRDTVPTPTAPATTTTAAAQQPSPRLKAITNGLLGALAVLLLMGVWRITKSNEELAVVTTGPTSVAVPASITPNVPASATPPSVPATSAPATQPVAVTQTKAECVAGCMTQQKLLWGDTPDTVAKVTPLCAVDPACANLN